MGSLVDVHSKTQAAQAESSVLPLPAPFSVPPRNTVVDADPPPVTSSPVIRPGGTVCATQITQASSKDKLQQELSIQQLPVQ